MSYTPGLPQSALLTFREDLEQMCIISSRNSCKNKVINITVFGASSATIGTPCNVLEAKLQEVFPLTENGSGRKHQGNLTDSCGLKKVLWNRTTIYTVLWNRTRQSELCYLYDIFLLSIFLSLVVLCLIQQRGLVIFLKDPEKGCPSKIVPPFCELFLVVEHPQAHL